MKKNITKIFFLLFVSIFIFFGVFFITNSKVVYGFDDYGEQGYFRLVNPNSDEATNNEQNAGSGESSGSSNFTIPSTGIH